jgi:hypothetical protein
MVWEIIYSGSKMKLIIIILGRNAELVNVKESERCICNAETIKQKEWRARNGGREI